MKLLVSKKPSACFLFDRKVLYLSYFPYQLCLLHLIKNYLVIFLQFGLWDHEVVWGYFRIHWILQIQGAGVSSYRQSCFPSPLWFHRGILLPQHRPPQPEWHLWQPYSVQGVPWWFCSLCSRCCSSVVFCQWHLHSARLCSNPQKSRRHRCCRDVSVFIVFDNIYVCLYWLTLFIMVCLWFHG